MPTNVSHITDLPQYSNGYAALNGVLSVVSELLSVCSCSSYPVCLMVPGVRNHDMCYIPVTLLILSQDKVTIIPVVSAPLWNATGGIPIGGRGLRLLFMWIFVLKKRKNHNKCTSKKADDPIGTVALMHDSKNASGAIIAISDHVYGLYDEPAFRGSIMPNNPLFDSADHGYKDLTPEPKLSGTLVESLLPIGYPANDHSEKAVNGKPEYSAGGVKSPALNPPLTTVGHTKQLVEGTAVPAVRSRAAQGRSLPRGPQLSPTPRWSGFVAPIGLMLLVLFSAPVDATCSGLLGNQYSLDSYTCTDFGPTALSSIPSNVAGQIVHLNLNNNAITSIANNTFVNLPKLPRTKGCKPAAVITRGSVSTSPTPTVPYGLVVCR